MPYFHDIKTSIRTTLKGLSLTLRHLRNATKRRAPVGIADSNYFELQNGLVTLQYPYEQLPIPDNGRYRLRNEIDDCIVCDKCAKVCPVDCITIDAIKATEEVGRASDGSPIRLYAATFDIDMAKCCYCGLCTVVCPTECLTMDKKFDYSEYDLGKLTYHFADLTPEQANEKRTLYEQFVLEKEAAKAAKLVEKPTPEATPAPATSAPKRPVFRPTAKPVAKAVPEESANVEEASLEHPLTDATPTEMQQIALGGVETTKKPVFRPTQKPKTPVTPAPTEARQEEPDVPIELSAPPKPPTKPASFRPTMKPPVSVPAPVDTTVPEPLKPKPVFRPTMKPAAPTPKTDSSLPNPETKATVKSEISQPEDVQPIGPPKSKTAFRPTMKPKPKADDSESV